MNPCQICGSTSEPRAELKDSGASELPDEHIVWVCPECGFEED